ncbi:MAG: 16S rRNA (uracil(1498)-N(3))-methyltransferase [Chloroflexota bacterium]
MHRFFHLDKPLQVGKPIDLQSISHQLYSVLRLQPGSQITLLDNSGFEYITQITRLARKQATGHILSKQFVQIEPTVDIILYQSTLKADKFEWILQKGTELGVARFVPVIAERSVVRSEEGLLKKRKRWLAIIREASEQSGRGRLPILAEPAPLPEILQEANGVKVLPWEKAKGEPHRTSINDLIIHSVGSDNHQAPQASLLVGPEGGLTDSEVDDAQQEGWAVVTLGPRILRAETAAIAALSLVLAGFGELG